MSYKQYGINSNLTQEKEPAKKQEDYSIHGKRIEQKTFPYILRAMTTAQRDTISKPQTGQMVFNTETLEVNVFSGISWEGYSFSTTSTSTSSSSSSSQTTSSSSSSSSSTSSTSITSL